MAKELIVTATGRRKESIARVRVRGHPPRVLRYVWADGEVAAGAPILSGSDVVGSITSSTAGETGRATALARVRWEAAEQPLSLADGRALLRVRRSG